jgi:hypothetical protein
MSTGLEISRNFIQRVFLPLLQEALPEDYRRLAVAVVGTGSDVLGWDDPISRDHHWGPRATVFYSRADAAHLEPLLDQILAGRLPATFEGYELRVGIGNLTGVCRCPLENFFERFLGTDQIPAADLDWLELCEVDLFHVTAGNVVFDGPGDLTRRRQALAYYPDNVWKKRLADWCMYVTGREAPYNLHRMRKRQDELTCTIYLGLCLKRQMELCFALNRRYAPYTKWLNKSFRELPKYAGELSSCIDDLMAESAWDRRVKLLIDGNYVLADALADLGLTKPVERRPFDEGLTDLTLYDSATQLYESLPSELRQPSFNQIEHWEAMARDVLFDANDYLRKAGDR